jgi:hypothetical protein
MQHILDLFISTDALHVQAVPPPVTGAQKLYIQLHILSTNNAACCDNSRKITAGKGMLYFVQYPSSWTDSLLLCT